MAARTDRRCCAAPIHRVPKPLEIDDGVGKSRRELLDVLRPVAGVREDELQPFDRERERGDVVMVEDARRHGTAALAAAIGQKRDLTAEVTRQPIEGPVEPIEPAIHPFQAALVLAADLLGNDPVPAGRADVIQVGLHERMTGVAGGRAGSGSPRYSTSNRARSQSDPMNTGLRIRWILRKAAQYVSEGTSCCRSTRGWRISWTTL